MEIFNLNGSAGSRPAGLIYTCSICDKSVSQKQAKVGCSCGARLFKVSRYMPLMNNPLTPYHTDDEEDGEKLTTVGDISTSVGGGNTPIESKPVPDVKQYGDISRSEDITLPDVMRDVNIPKSKPIDTTPMNVFERTRKRLRD